jgi:hypothetical protein
MRPPRRLLAATVLLATAFAGSPALLSSADAAPGTSDRSVARAADRYGVSEKGLQQRLRSDPDFHLTTSGVAYVVDPAPSGKKEATRLIGQAFPLPQTFLLHSKPDSQRTIYLDFNGGDVSNTYWNTDIDGAGPAIAVPNGSHPALDLGGNGAAFSDPELMQVQDIYQRVAEDYAPFDVDVTTEEPPAADLDRTNSGDQVYGVRAMISPSDTALNNICQGGCGGIAFIGVFDHYAGKNSDGSTHAQYQPAWVFPQALTGGNVVKNIAEATTHEVGHNLGLDHDGTNSQGYYDGNLNDMWAPIMGVGYNKPVAQFALSDYPDANLGGPGPGSAQSNPDDLATIDTFLSSAGDLRTDEPGTSTGNAGAVPTGSAYITSRTDVDYYALGTCSGNVTVTASGAEVSPNLDIEVQLINSGGTVVDSDNPPSAFVNLDIASGMDAAAAGTSLPSGQYFARIDGIARGTAATTYTDYGSIGAYTLSVSGCGGIVATPPSVPLSLTGAYLGSGDVELSWAPPADNGGASITSYQVYMDGVLLGSVPPAVDNGALVDNVPSGVHDFGVAAVNSSGEGPQAHVSVNATDVPQAVPGKTRIGKATPGKRGGKRTAKVTWQPPAASANPAINGYQIIAYRENNKGKFVKFSTSPVQSAAARSIVFTTDSRARLKFAVKARNSLGFGALSSKSNAVRAR